MIFNFLKFKFLQNNYLILSNNLSRRIHTNNDHGINKEVFENEIKSHRDMRVTQTETENINNIASLLLTQFKNESIIKIINKSNIDRNILTDIEENLLKLFIIIEIIRRDFNTVEIFNIKMEIFNHLEKLGINKILIKKVFKEYVNNIDTNFNMDSKILKEYNGYLDEINAIVLSKCNGLSESVYKKLEHCLKLSYEFKDMEKYRNIMISNIITDLKEESKTESIIKGRKKRTKKPNPSYFKGAFSVCVISEVRKLNEIMLNNIMNFCNNKFYNLVEDMKIFNEILLNNYKYNIKLLIKNYSLNYNKPSMEGVNLRKMEVNERLLNLFGGENVSKLDLLLNNINENDFNNIGKKELKSRVEKYNVDGALMVKIKMVLDDYNLDNYTKQIAIEKISLEYDLNWFANELKSSLDARSVILHDIYKTFNNNLKVITHPYLKNNLFKLKILINNSNIKNDNGMNNIKLVSLLVILVLGNDAIISTTFKNIIEIINISDNMRVNRTELVFKLGVKIIKYAIYKLDNTYKFIYNNMDIHNKYTLEDIIRIKDILNLLPFDMLHRFLSDFKNNNLGMFEIGDTFVNILEKHSNIFDRVLLTNNDVKEVFISVKDEYLNKLNVSVINITQLPMLVKPNGPTEDKKYLPYIQGEISHIYNTFDSVVKNKHSIRDVVENQQVLNNTINYLNNTPFKINLEVLDFILKEWHKETSVYFKGVNKLQIVNKKDSEEIKRNKQSHNSKYWRYLNIINIATLYKNECFYLPTFADFRGRIYTLTQNLTYQGDDLCRSLLLFANEDKPLNQKGRNYLFLYFANLCGKKNLEYREIIEWSKNNITNIINMFMKENDKFNSEILVNVKEPFQLISIILALVKYIHSLNKNKNFVLNNPILFDASCNGLQHLSALTREVSIATKTNLISLDNSPEIKNDFYAFVASMVQEVIDNHKSLNIRSLSISRDLVKKSVMTIPYNISIYGVKEQMRENFQVFMENNRLFYKVDGKYTKDNNVLYMLPSEVNTLGGIVYDTILSKLPSLRILNEYLDGLLLALSKLNKPVIWITPLGLKISLANIKYESIRTSSSLLPYGKPVTISIPTNNLNSKKNKSSFMPNLVHSLDASNIHLLCENLNNIPLYTIHDCFASTANNMGTIENKVKEAFIKIYFTSGNYLEKMHINIVDQINSYTQIFTKTDGTDYILIDKKEYIIPKIPPAFTNPAVANTFMKGIRNSKFFIS